MKLTSKTWLIIVLILLIILIAFLPVTDMKISITGAVVSKVFVRGAQSNVSCTAPLSQGWNLMSIPCLSSNASPLYVLYSLGDNLSSVHQYDADDPSDHWKVYNPSGPAWVVQDITAMSEKKGYWIYVLNASTLSANGTLTNPNQINLMKGWNLIGYPASSQKTAAEAFSSIDGGYTMVWSYNGSTGEFSYYTVSEGNGTLTTIKPNLGYWLNTTDNDLLFIS